MAVHAHVAIHVEIVKQNKLAGQGVVIGCHALAEYGQVRLPVAFLHVSQNLIVSAILFNYVEDMLDGAGRTGEPAESFPKTRAPGTISLSVDLLGERDGLGPPTDQFLAREDVDPA